MFFQKLFLVVVLFMILCNAQRLVSPSGKDCSSTYDYSTSYFSNDCVGGSIYDDFYDLDFRCSCLCTLPWNYKFNHVCNSPRRHRVTCGFGGPRWYINCWNPSELVYRRYESIMRFSHLHLPVNIKFNHSSLQLTLSYYLNHSDSSLGLDGYLNKLNVDLNQPLPKILKI